MSQGHAVRAARGKKNPAHLYIKLKGGAVYQYEKPLTAAQQTIVTDGLKKSAGKVKLKFWVKRR